ncbi:alpha-amylase family glycosyl hydrolase [Spirochaeta lutea]|uniref:alpha-amylase family glycosyl hydrolase n=1 Tax=Spirochaeta lutea TaxID=1480694 RepID=UPI00068F1FBD|nr:alpha-amylase family glycosyl hydrolase [Spirochaeta lutea]
MERDAHAALGLLEPVIQEALGNLPVKHRQAFSQRMHRYFPQLFPRLFELYGHRWDFYFHLETLIRRLAEGWRNREADLKKLDYRREEDPYWFRSQTMVGAMLYVDLYAKTLEGLRQRIDYLKDIGITYIHLMPLFKAPESENDGGYAISSYREVMPELGTMKQLQELARDLRRDGISLVLDFVFNHTSHEHIWARKAKEGDPEYRDYYFVLEDEGEVQEYNRTLRDIFPDVRKGSFTYEPEMEAWVWTTFNSYQWDLNYQNPKTFTAMVEEMLFIANHGAEVLRLDALAFTWKEKGTGCENLPKAHTLIQCFRLAAKIAAPAMVFKSEAIVHPSEVVKYISSTECEVSYNPLLMALLWESLATRRVNLLEHSLQRRFGIPGDCAWVNYVRSHDDIGWTFADEDAAELGINGYDHRRFLNDFYTGTFEGSFARGVPFQYNPLTGDCRISGTAGSLTGLEMAVRHSDPDSASTEAGYAEQRMLLIHSIIMAIGGIPVLYLGDELARLNWYGYTSEAGKSKDSRWVHRPAFDWDLAGRTLSSLGLPVPGDGAAGQTDGAAGQPGGAKNQNQGTAIQAGGPAEQHTGANAGSGSEYTSANPLEDSPVFHKASESVFRSLKRMIELRKSLTVLGQGETQVLSSGNQHVLAFLRSGDARQLLVLANFSENPQQVRVNLLRLNGLYPNPLDLLAEERMALTEDTILLQPYQVCWLVP